MKNITRFLGLPGRRRPHVSINRIRPVAGYYGFRRLQHDARSSLRRTGRGVLCAGGTVLIVHVGGLGVLLASVLTRWLFQSHSVEETDTALLMMVSGLVAAAVMIAGFPRGGRRLRTIR